MAVLAGIRVSEDAIEEEDPAVEMVEDVLCVSHACQPRSDGGICYLGEGAAGGND